MPFRAWNARTEETNMPLACFLCPDCESVHFIVRWTREASDTASHSWMICCEGCGAIYRLLPNGAAELHMRGIEQN